MPLSLFKLTLNEECTAHKLKQDFKIKFLKKYYVRHFILDNFWNDYLKNLNLFINKTICFYRVSINCASSNRLNIECRIRTYSIFDMKTVSIITTIKLLLAAHSINLHIFYEYSFDEWKQTRFISTQRQSTAFNLFVFCSVFSLINMHAD